jgi:AAA family ATPase
VKFNNIVPDSYTIEKKTPQSPNGPKKEAKVVVLQSIGYPFLCNLVENPKIEIFDKELFELYAREQWEGYEVDEGSFLVDQKLLPDVAGKTMLAKSLSNELNVPLFLVKATRLIGEQVGDGARQIHELFEAAAESAPSVIFIDEMDAIGLDRKYQSLRGDVSEVVNALLTEMDGIDQNYGVVTIGATNNPHLLDYAIRSRFEEEIEFEIPNKDQRQIMLQNYIKTMPVEVKVNVERLTNATKGMSGRDIKERLLKTALHKAISEDMDAVNWDQMEYALKLHKREKNEPKHMFA